MYSGTSILRLAMGMNISYLSSKVSVLLPGTNILFFLLRGIISWDCLSKGDHNGEVTVLVR